MDMGDAGLKLAAARERVRAAKEIYDAASLEVETLESELLDAMMSGGVDSFKSGGFHFVVSRSDKPTLDDYEALREYVATTGEFDLFNRTVNTKAVRERWSAGVGVPGVGWYTKLSLSMRKA